MTDATAHDDDIAGVFESKALYRPAAPALHGLGTCLEDIQFAVVAILAPLDIHRTAVMILNGHGHSGEFDNVLIRNGEPEAVIFVHIDGVYRLARLGIVAVDHFDGLTTQVFAQNGEFAGGKCRFIRRAPRTM